MPGADCVQNADPWFFHCGVHYVSASRAFNLILGILTLGILTLSLRMPWYCTFGPFNISLFALYGSRRHRFTTYRYCSELDWSDDAPLLACLLALWLNIMIPVGSIGLPKLYSVGKNILETCCLIVLLLNMLAGFDMIVVHGKWTLDVARLLPNLVHINNVVNQVLCSMSVMVVQEAINCGPHFISRLFHCTGTWVRHPRVHASK